MVIRIQDHEKVYKFEYFISDYGVTITVLNKQTMKEKEIYNVNKLQIFHTKMQMYRVIDEKTLKIKKSGLSEHCINSFYKTLNDNKKYITECVADKYEDIKRDSKRNNNEKNKE